MKYIATITNNGASDKGFIDPKKPQDYPNFDNIRETVKRNLMIKKAKGFLRWYNLSMILSSICSWDDLQVEVTGGTCVEEPYKLQLTLETDKEFKIRISEDRIVPVEEGIQHFIALAMSLDFTGITEIWNSTTKKEGDKTVIPYGMETVTVTAEKLFDGVDAALGNVTVQAEN